MKNKKILIFGMFALTFFIFLYPEMTLYLALRLALTLGILLVVLILLKVTIGTIKMIGKDSHTLMQLAKKKLKNSEVIN